jgi:hypothetical protein
MGSLLELPRYPRQHLLVFCYSHAAFALRWPLAEEGVRFNFSALPSLSLRLRAIPPLSLRSALRSLLLLSPNK